MSCPLRLLVLLCLAALLSAASGRAEALTPANRAASRDARALLAYIDSLRRSPDVRVLIGQQIGQPGTFEVGYREGVEGLHKATGKWPAMIGIDYCYPGPVSPKAVAEANALLIPFAKAGGIVEASAHIGNPWGGDVRAMKHGEWSELFAPGSAANAKWQDDWRKVADGLAELQTAGVTVLWRPLHEMNGGWFWWHTDPATYRKLWNWVFDYMTRERKLNNLLWVFAPNAGEDAATYYPGADRCDIVGLDYYGRDFNIAGYTAMAALDKPFGLTEWGVDPSGRTADGQFDLRKVIAGIENHAPAARFFLTWSSWTNAHMALVDNLNAAEMLADKRSITRDRLPKLTTSPAAPGGQSR